tara:strand:+ start:2710 stop:3090 length:381 start_codon:yes stop_codon:yes gene_type:complete
MKIVGLGESRYNPILFDTWSIIHYLSGVIFAIWMIYLKVNFLYGFVLWFFIHALHEIKDLIWTKYNIYGWNVSVLNCLGNQFIAVIGFITPYIFENVINYARNLHILIFLLFIILVFDLVNKRQKK